MIGLPEFSLFFLWATVIVVFQKNEAGIYIYPLIELQYSSQIVETDTVSLEFSGKILTFLLHTVFPPEMCLLPPQC